MKSLGQIAYEAYCEGWKSLASGQPLPKWVDVKPEIKAAWEAVGSRFMDMTPGSVVVAIERSRQIREEKWDGAHDAQHEKGELVAAAIAYAASGAKIETKVKIYTEPRCQCGARGMADCTCVMQVGDQKWVHPWPWEKKWFKPKDALRDLIRAGALIVAEIDRMIRQDTEDAEPPDGEKCPRCGARMVSGICQNYACEHQSINAQ